MDIEQIIAITSAELLEMSVAELSVNSTAIYDNIRILDREINYGDLKPEEAESRKITFKKLQSLLRIYTSLIDDILLFDAPVYSSTTSFLIK